MDFGLVQEGVASNTLLLKVFTNLEKGVEIETISAENSQSETDTSIYLHLLANTPIPINCGAKLQPGEPVSLADINVSPVIIPPPSKSQQQTLLYKRQGTIVAISRSGKYNVTVPYKAIMYRG